MSPFPRGLDFGKKCLQPGPAQGGMKLPYTEGPAHGQLSLPKSPVTQVFSVFWAKSLHSVDSVPEEGDSRK